MLFKHTSKDQDKESFRDQVVRKIRWKSVRLEEAKLTLRGQQAHTPGSYLILSEAAAFTVVVCVA